MSSVNTLYLGDNLEILKKLDTESVDLIYLDPPFFSNRNYEVIWGDSGEVRSFVDRWSGGVDHYIAWLKERVAEMHRILKPTGSIFLHCDWHANAYIRVEILDKIFGYGNFKGEIIWRRTSAHNDAKQGRKAVGNVTETIWYYTKSSDYTYNQLYTDYTESYMNEFYRYEDPDGRRYRLGDLTGPGGASKGNPYYEVLGVSRHWRYSKEKMSELISQGRIIQTKPGAVPSYKRYLDEMPGVALQNDWNDIKPVQSQAKERIGYPTQKPLALLERILKMASNEGDVVLDPFVGGGTTVAAADRLQRRWIGIDQSVQAVKVTELRLQQQQDLFSKPFVVQLHKYDYDTLFCQNPYTFERWIVEQYGGTPNSKQRGDLGLDGKAPDGAPVQVKQSEGIGRNVVDNFVSAAKRVDARTYEQRVAEGKPVGYIIAFSFGKGAVQEVARLKNSENIIIRLVEVGEIVPISKKPSLTLAVADEGTDKKKLREIRFTATAHSEAGIEFYAWDFAYDAEKGFKPGVLIDKEGMQTHAFKPGLHSIACKVIDNDGLENIEIIRLKVNGEITQL